MSVGTGEQPAPRPQVIRNQELLHAAVMHAGGEQNLARPGMTRENQKVLNSAQAKMAEREGVAALDLVSTSLTETERGVADLAKQLIEIPGVGVDQARIDKINILYKGIHDLQNGQNIDPASRRAVIEAFVNGVAANPLLRAQFVPGGRANEQKIIDFLRSTAGNQLAVNVNLVMERAKAQKKPAQELAMNIAKNRVELIKADNKLKSTAEARLRLNRAQNDLIDFNRDRNGQPRLDLLVNSMPEVRDMLSDLDDIQGILFVQAQKGTLSDIESRRLMRLQTQVQQAKADSTRGAFCTEAETIYNKKQRLMELAKKANDPIEIQKAQAEFETAEQELKNAKQYELDQISLHEDISTQFEAAVEHVIREAAIESFKTDVTEFMAKNPQYEKEALDELEKSGRDKLTDFIEARYKKSKDVGLIFKKKVSAYDAELVDKDMQMLGVPPNPDKLLNLWLDSGVSAEEKAAILSNPDTVKVIRKDMVGKLFVASTQLGQRMNEPQLRAIASTEWGRGALDSMLNENQVIKQYLEKTIGKGYGSRDVLNKFGMLNLLMLLLMSLGIVKTPGVPLNEN